MAKKKNRESVDGKNNTPKAQMFYAHTYRHLHPQRNVQLGYLFLFVLPTFILMLLFYSDISLLLSQITHAIIDTIDSGMLLGISSSDYLPYLGDIYFVSLPTFMPETSFVLINLAVLAGIFLILNLSKLRGLPTTIFINISLLLMFASCIFFLFAPYDFPYTATEYSRLFMEKQIAVWIFFILLAGLIISFVGKERVDLKVITYLSIIVYSFSFGIVRYVTFMIVIARFSMLYSVVLYFTFGPLFDFLYFVLFYSIYIDRLSKYYDKQRDREVWGWM